MFRSAARAAVTGTAAMLALTVAALVAVKVIGSDTFTTVTGLDVDPLGWLWQLVTAIMSAIGDGVSGWVSDSPVSEWARSLWDGPDECTPDSVPLCQ